MNDGAPRWTLLLGCGTFTITAEAAQSILDTLRGRRRQQLVIVELDGRPSWVAIAHVAALSPQTTQPEPERKPISVVADHAHRARNLS